MPALDDLVVGDSRELGHIIDAGPRAGEQIMATITSPPYWNLKNYGTTSQIGWRQSYQSYLADCESVFKQIFDRTAESGAMWVISDTMLDRKSTPKALINLPSDLASRASMAGWVLRDIYIWQKDRTIPYTSHGRVRNAFEYIHFYVKSEGFKFYSDRLRDPTSLTSWWVQYPERYNPRGKAPTNVWTYPIPTQGAWGNGSVQHACPLPPDMVERMILLSTDEGDLVFDPFAGTGTVLSEARRLERHSLGIELNPSYVRQYQDQINAAVIERNEEDSAVHEAKEAARLGRLIRQLRVVKFPKSMSRLYAKTYGTPLDAVALYVESLALAPETRAVMTVVVSGDLSDDELSALATRVRALETRYPLSQFQVEIETRVQRVDQFVSDGVKAPIFFYEHGRTWSVSAKGDKQGLVLLSRSSKVGRYLPIGSNVHLDEEAHRPYA